MTEQVQPIHFSSERGDHNFFWLLAALPNTDYFSIFSVEIFPAGSIQNDTECTDIIITDDDALEGDQTFTVTLTTSDPNVILGTNTVLVIIRDNDGTSSSLFYGFPKKCDCRCDSVCPSHGERW